MSTEYKTRPDEPGWWWYWQNIAWVHVMITELQNGELRATSLHSIKEGYWVRNPEPDPPYPPKPRMVYGTYKRESGTEPQWFMELSEDNMKPHDPFLSFVKKRNVYPLPHPDNDPDLVREIEEAKKKP